MERPAFGQDFRFLVALQLENLLVPGALLDGRHHDIDVSGIPVHCQGIRLAKAGRLPTLSISASYNLRADDLTLDSDEVEKTYAGYLVLSLPIFDGFRTKSQISKSYSQLRQAELARAGLEDAIELEVRSALLEIEAALETLKSQEKNVEMAEEGLEIANKRYLQGYATNLEVMDAQLALTRARNNRIQALHDLSWAVAKAKKSMGVLLGDYKSGARS